MVKSSKISARAISFLLFYGFAVTTIVTFAEDTLASDLKFTLISPSSTATAELLAQSPTEPSQPTTPPKEENIALEVAKLFLEFFKVLVWPIVAIYLIRIFKSEVKELLKQRLINAEILGSKFVFQPAVQEAPFANPKAKVELSQVTSTGFFNSEGIRNIVSQSGLLSSDEEAISELLLFDNVEQHTWIVVSISKVLIVLDDSDTRKSNQLIQMVMSKENTLPLEFRPAGGNAGVVKFGNYKPWWYYSLHIFPTPTTLERDFQELLTCNS